MVKYYSQQLDRTFFALSDPTRRAIIGNLAKQGPTSVLEIAQPFDLSLPAVSKHLKLLEDANLVTRTVKGRVHYLELSANPMSEANEWLTAYRKFWENQFDALERFLKADRAGERDDNED
jgi:DNA-binding transcriptional ArsR family regulator